MAAHEANVRPLDCRRQVQLLDQPDIDARGEEAGTRNGDEVGEGIGRDRGGVEGLAGGLDRERQGGGGIGPHARRRPRPQVSFLAGRQEDAPRFARPLEQIANERCAQGQMAGLNLRMLEQAGEHLPLLVVAADEFGRGLRRVALGDAVWWQGRAEAEDREAHHALH
jgi:hypothetical protein